MTTQLVPVSTDSPDERVIEQAADVVLRGGLVAFPTETVYGLGADATNPKAVKNVFAVKGRPADNPLIVHIASADQLHELGYNISHEASVLARSFWPGPLTLVVRKKPVIPDIVTAGLDSVAVRFPRHPVPVALLKKVHYGMVGPSANLSGRPSPTTAQHVFEDLNGFVDMILDAGPTHIGVESTVVDTTASPPTILRLGGISREDVESAVGTVRMATSSSELRRSPGTRYRHYAPKARVELIDEGNSTLLHGRLAEYRRNGSVVGAIVHTPGIASSVSEGHIVALSANIQEYARKIFGALRSLDALGVDVILIERVNESGLGATVMDRLNRAAQPR